MSVHAGDTLLHYRVLDKIGEGGMGEVWLARDTTLDRDVAIKLLPAAFALDAERLGRFEREAKVLASLNHPNIAAIHGLHEVQGQRFLAMELVPGEDLAARIARGAISVDEATVLARKIADALEYAHEHGIVHRDLKPANIKITPDGDVKVLDFGLAKAMDPGGESSVSAMNSPTLTARATAAGVILGTAAYMSPEQARGKTVDKRADNWAFGCVLYEMLVGGRLFDGETVTDVLAAVVTRDPDWTRLPAGTPASVRRLLERCFQKDPRARLRDIGEARIVLEHPGAVESSVPATASPAGPSMWTRLVAAAAVMLIVGVLLGRYLLAPAQPAARPYEFDVTAPEGRLETGSVALSPDGASLAMVVRPLGGSRQLAIRDLAAVDVHVLAGTDGAEYPFWSPNGEEVAYFSGNQLYRVSRSGTAPRPIATVVDPRGGTWGPSDVILVGSGTGPILKTSASGGMKPEPITSLTGDEDAHAWPTFLPDGRRFLFLRDATTDDGHKISLGSIDGGAITTLKTGVRSQPVLDRGGRLLIGERGQLLAYPFDVQRGVLGTEGELLATQIYPMGNQHHLPASTAPGRAIAFQQGSADMNLVVLDQTGRVTRTIGEPARYGNPRLSPDGTRVAYEIFTDTNERLVWAEDLRRGVRTPISPRGALADGSAWAPDNETVYFDSNAGSSQWHIMRRTFSGGGDPEDLGGPATATDAGLLGVSPNGRQVLMFAAIPDNRRDLFLRSTDAKDGQWTPWASGPANEDGATFSPDSRWIAYVSDMSGQSEVYVAPVDGGPTKRRLPISSGGGLEPAFSSNGRELYYRTPSFDWMVVDVKLTPDSVEAGTPRKLFSMPAIELPYVRNLMEVIPDGSGFMTVRPSEAQLSSSFIRVRVGK
jgi:Tol biopolymer transport system component